VCGVWIAESMHCISVPPEPKCLLPLFKLCSTVVSWLVALPALTVNTVKFELINSRSRCENGAHFGTFCSHCSLIVQNGTDGWTIEPQIH
jgi:hypothetical protein